MYRKLFVKWNFLQGIFRIHDVKNVSFLKYFKVKCLFLTQTEHVEMQTCTGVLMCTLHRKAPAGKGRIEPRGCWLSHLSIHSKLSVKKTTTNKHFCVRETCKESYCILQQQGFLLVSFRLSGLFLSPGGSRKLDFAVEFDTHFDVGTSWAQSQKWKEIKNVKHL